jgi:hypothetical protein
MANNAGNSARFCQFFSFKKDWQDLHRIFISMDSLEVLASSGLSLFLSSPFPHFQFSFRNRGLYSIDDEQSAIIIIRPFNKSALSESILKG